MTERQQRRFYFPAWNRCASVHDWMIRKGRLVGRRAQAFGSPTGVANQLYHAVWAAAEQCAAQHLRAITPDDLRHACHIVALGVDKPSIKLDNKEADKVVTLFRVPTDADDVDAVLDWSHPEAGERKRLVHQIRTLADFHYIDHLCRHRSDWAYESPFWEDLPVSALRQLALTLRSRQASRDQAPETTTDSEPF